MEILWHHVGLVGLCAVLGLVAGGIYVAVTERIYLSSTRICLRPSQSRSGSELRPAMLGNSSNLLGTQCEIIRSTPVLSGALTVLERSASRNLQRKNDPMSSLQARLSAEVGKRDDVITIRYEGPDAEESAAIVAAVVESYSLWLKAQNHSALENLCKNIAEEKQSWNRQLGQQRQSLAEFRRTHPSLGMELDRRGVGLQKLSQISSSLTVAQLESINAKAEHSAVGELASNPAGVAQLLESGPSRPELNNINAELVRLRASLSEQEMRCQLSAGKLGEGHPQLKEARRATEQLREKVAAQTRRMLDGYLAATERRLADARAKERDLQQVLEQEHQKNVAADAQLAEWTSLDTACRRTSAICESLDSRLHELGMTAGTESNLIEVLDPAKVPTQPIYPRKRRILPLALAAGLMIGALAALGLDATNKRFRSSAEIVATLHAPVIGVIPSAKRKTQSGELENQLTDELVEACRSVRAALRRPDTPLAVKTILVASAEAQEGRTLVARHLAMAMARAGQRVLLIDADAHRPSLHETFKIDNTHGLVALSTRSVELAQAVCQTQIAWLQLLPAGSSGAGTKDLLESGRMASLLESLSEQYDQIVLDSSPVLGGIDTQILSSLCDATVFVLRADRSKRPTTELAIEALLNQRANLIGFVVNATPSGRTGVESVWHCRYCAVDTGTDGNGSGQIRDAVATRSAA